MAKILTKPTQAQIIATCCSILDTTPAGLIEAVQKLADETDILRLKQENLGIRRLLENAIKGLGSESGYLDPAPMLAQLDERFAVSSGDSRAIEDDMAEGFCCSQRDVNLIMIAPDGRFTPVGWGEEHCLIEISPEKDIHDLTPGEETKALVLTIVSGILAPVSIAAAHSQPVLQYVAQRHAPENVCVCRGRGENPRRYELTWSEPIDPKLIEARYGKKAAARARPDKPTIELSVKYVGPHPKA